jgi:fructose-1,6-bisphosphatase I
MITTVQHHIMQEQRRFPDASGEFSLLLSGITLATKMIAARVRRAGLSDVFGASGEVNVHGEAQQKLDVYANEALIHCLNMGRGVGVLASEENEEPLILAHCPANANYAVVFDPLDGSSNIDVNVGVGTVFSVLRRPEQATCQEPEKWVLQPGSRQVAAGYVIYGSSTVLVYSVGLGVHGFTLDPAVGSYVLTHSDIRMPPQGRYYAVNEAHASSFPAGYRRYLEGLRSGALGHCYETRYTGSMVVDIHRTLLKGGVFLYPPSAKYPQGKLRLLYEANPVALLAEQAGGAATDGRCPILEVEPHDIHQRTPLAVGSPTEMAALADHLSAT